MKYFISILITALLFMSAYANAAAPKKVLIIASNVVNMGDPEKHDARNKLWEIAPPSIYF
jgi:hypothetical protein